MSCASFLQKSFVESFNAEVESIPNLVEAAIGFTAEKNQFSESEQFIEKSSF